MRLASFLMAALLAFPQQVPSPEPPPPLTIKSDVRQVLVPVVVTDKAGHYVTDLGRDDFSVLEDGAPQRIVAFRRSAMNMSDIDAAAPNKSKGANIGQPVKGGSVSPERTYLICIDTLHSDFSNFVQVRRALRKFFLDEHAEDSQYALMAIGRATHVVVDSTRDPSVILAAIESKRLLATIQESEAANIANQSELFLHQVGAWCGQCPCTNQTMDLANPLCPALKGQVQASIFSFSERAFLLNESFLQQLAQVVNAMASMPTKRTVVFLSDGFNRFAGQELHSILNGLG